MRVARCRKRRMQNSRLMRLPYHSASAQIRVQGVSLSQFMRFSHSSIPERQDHAVRLLNGWYTHQRKHALDRAFLRRSSDSSSQERHAMTGSAQSKKENDGERIRLTTLTEKGG